MVKPAGTSSDCIPNCAGGGQFAVEVKVSAIGQIEHLDERAARGVCRVPPNDMMHRSEQAPDEPATDADTRLEQAAGVEWKLAAAAVWSLYDDLADEAAT